ncbi:MAG: efflux RND transporter periplasmic adaptor subunit [Gammaproteobacteria bacterium]|nr:efflux RND transporter periplasmic adaptor subunit [Gammaproteobacteria bacterium]
MKRLFYFLLLMPTLVSASEWTTRPLAELAVYPEFRAPARVLALNEAHLAAEVGGRIEALPVRVGQAVQAGAELARIDTADYRIAAGQAAARVELGENRLRLAQTQLDQFRILAQDGHVSEDQLRIKVTEHAVLESELELARLALEAAELQRARTVIRAPFDGLVRERLASVGDLAAAGTPLLVLVSTRDTEVQAQVPAAQIEALPAAADWRLWLDGQTHGLRLERILAVVEPAGQTQVVVFSADTGLVPGRAGELRWRSPQAHLPGEYLVERDGRLGAWIEEQGQARFIGLSHAAVGRPVAVDWPSDTRVIDAGRFRLGLPPAGAGATQ